MAVGRFRHEVGKDVFHFKFDHNAIYEFEKQNNGVAIGHLVPGTVAVGMCVDLLALSITGLPGNEKTLEKKRLMVLKMMDRSKKSVQWFQEKVLEGIGVMIFDDETRADAGMTDDKSDDDDAETAEDPSHVDGTES